MAQTLKLLLRLMEDTDKFSIDSFNAVINDLDNKLLSKSHDSTIAHWDKWDKNKNINVGDVLRITNLPTGLFYKATVAGTTGTTEPTNNVVGST